MINLITQPKGQDFWLWDGLDLELAIEVINNSNVRRVSLNFVDNGAPEDLDFLLRFDGIVSLSIDSRKSININALKHLTSLKKICLCKNSWADFNLSELKNIEDLSIEFGRWNPLSDIYMPNVKEILFENYKGKDLSFLCGFPCVKNITLLQFGNVRDLTGIEKCLELERLIICYFRNLVDVSSLGPLQKLAYLELQNLNKLISVMPVFGVNSLKALIVDKVPKIGSLNGLASLVNLEILSLFNVEVIDGDLGFILEMPRLRHCFIKPNKKHYKPSANYLNEYFNISAKY